MFQNSTQTTVTQSANYFYLIGILLLIVILVAIVFIWRSRQKKETRIAGILNRVFFEILVPREASEDQFGQEATKQNEKELIGIAEQLLNTLWFPPVSGLDHFFHRQSSLTLEIAAHNKKIHFYLSCPRKMKSSVERHVHAQYPKAHLEEVEPYEVFKKENDVAGAEIGLQKKYIYPIKTFDEQNTDPLNAVTNAMSKLTANEAAVFQLILVPAPPKWGNYLQKIAMEIQAGKKPQEIDKSFWRSLGGSVGSEVKDLLKSDSPNVQPEIQKPLTPMQQELVKHLEEKGSKMGYYVNLRILTSSESENSASSHLNGLLSTLTQYSLNPLNGFKVVGKNTNKIVHSFLFRDYLSNNIIFNTKELASLWHPPTRYMETPNIAWLTAKTSPPPVNMPEEGILLGENFYRGNKTEVRMLPDDRRRHMYIIGRTGTGKTELMKNMSVQDIKNGAGVCVIDPHGDFIEDILPHIPKERADDVIIFDPADMNYPFGLNMLEVKDEAQKDFVVQEMISIFQKLFPPEYLGPMFEHNMRNIMLTLLADIEDPGTIAEIPRMFSDAEFQQKYVDRLTDPSVKSFWEQEMAKTSDFHKSEMLGYLVSKVGRFVENTMMRNIIGQQKSSFDFRKVMDENKILLVNLSKGKIGEINAKLLGLIIVSKLQMAALSRANVPESERKDFYLYVDEFQNFVTDSFSVILSEARKYRLNLVIAHQYLAQLSAEKPGSSAQDSSVRDAVFGNVGSMAAFRVGVDDSEIIAREMAPVFSDFDVVNIEKFNAYVKLMIHSTASRPFSMKTIALGEGNKDIAQALKDLSRYKYGRKRLQVEGEILERSQIDEALKEFPDPMVEAS